MKSKILLLPLMAVIIAGCAAGTVTENKAPQKEAPAQIINKEKQMENENQARVNQAPKIVLAPEINKPVIKTNFGDIKIELDRTNAPVSVENFIKYAKDGFYNGTIFHRVMDGFMIQGGGFDQSGKEKETLAPIKNEAQNGLKNNRGALAMARTPEIDSATSQFFINLIDNDFLNYRDEANYGYAVFGQVIEGMEVVDAIAKVKTANRGMHENWPVENVIIESVEIVE